MLGRLVNMLQPSDQGGIAYSRYLLEPADFVWALGSLCALNKIPFEAELLLKQFPPPCTTDTLIHAARAL
ncbi:MAG: hypothetical protein ACLGGY_06970, partial [Gammaproteobacteria bacterium]